MGERCRAPDVRVCRIRPRHRLHLVGEQPRQPAHALAQRSRDRSSGRGDLFSRRRERPRVVGDASASRRRTAVHRPPWAGLQRLRTRARWDRVSPPRLRRRRRAGQGIPDRAAQCVEPPSAADGDDLRGMGPRREPRPHRPPHRHAPRTDDGRVDRVQRVSRSVCGSRGVPGPVRRRPPHGDRRPDRIHRPQWFTRAPRRRSIATRCRTEPGREWTRAARCRFV